MGLLVHIAKKQIWRTQRIERTVGNRKYKVKFVS